MKRLPYVLFLLIWTIGALAQEIEIYDDYADYESNLISDNGKIYVVNYWATWCAPCIKELPYFEQLGKEYKDRAVDVVLVSLDFKNQYDSKLVPFVKKHDLNSRIIHMADPNSNKWIDRVNPAWSGAIPITLFRIGEDQLFMERSFESYADLKLELDKFLESIQ